MFFRQVRFKIYHFPAKTFFLVSSLLSSMVHIKLFLVMGRSPIFYVLFHIAGDSKQTYKSSNSRKLRIQLSWSITANVSLISSLSCSCLIIKIFLFLFGLKKYVFECVVTYFFYNNRIFLLIEQAMHLIGSRITAVYWDD